MTHVRYLPRQTSTQLPRYNQLLTTDLPLDVLYYLNKKCEQEQYYRYFTTWEGETDLQPPINLCWCKTINPDLLVGTSFFTFFFLSKNTCWLMSQFFCRFMLILMNCLCKNKSFIPFWTLSRWLRGKSKLLHLKWPFISNSWWIQWKT